MSDNEPIRISELLRQALVVWPLLWGIVVLMVPTLITLGQQVWVTELGAHGPIVLVTGLWLLGTQRRSFQALRAPPSWPVVVLGLALFLPVYIFGRAYDLISLEALGAYGAAITIAYREYGPHAIKANLFPFGYLGFLVPPPGWVINTLTSPLRAFVSYMATHGLHYLGYPVANEGVAITIAQYQLLVEDACSGMNSIVGLTAITLFYVYVLHRGSWRYALLLTALIIPLAVFINILRVVTLILLTYYAGDGVAQGFLHGTTGIVLFAVGLLLMLVIDHTLRLLLRKQV